jgi:hypothetical protein
MLFSCWMPLGPFCARVNLLSVELSFTLSSSPPQQPDSCLTYPHAALAYTSLYSAELRTGVPPNPSGRALQARGISISPTPLPPSLRSTQLPNKSSKSSQQSPPFELFIRPLSLPQSYFPTFINNLTSSQPSTMAPNHPSLHNILRLPP